MRADVAEQQRSLAAAAASESIDPSTGISSSNTTLEVTPPHVRGGPIGW